MARSEECGIIEQKSADSPEKGQEAHKKPLRFIIVIRGRNCKEYVAKCLHSLEKQLYPYWEAMVVLDEPTDGSERIAATFVKPFGKIFIHVNEKRLGLCHNMYFAIRWAACILKPDDDTVFAILDADDSLSKTALLRVERVFRKYPKTLITHGSYIKMSIGRKTKISRLYPKSGNIRKLPWRASHLKTVKWSVLKNIKDEWFQDKGKWLDAASDLALMFPCIEIAGLKRVKHIPQAIYYWNDNTPSKTGRSAQIRCEKILRAM